jgi:hypothetical protein
MSYLITDYLNLYSRDAAANTGSEPLTQPGQVTTGNRSDLSNQQPLGSAPNAAYHLKFQPDSKIIFIASPVGNIRLELPEASDNSHEGASILASVSARFLAYESGVEHLEMQFRGRTPLEKLCRGVEIEVIWEDAVAQGRELRRQKLALGSAHFEASHPEYHYKFGSIDITLVLLGEHAGQGECSSVQGSRGWGARNNPGTAAA